MVRSMAGSRKLSARRMRHLVVRAAPVGGVVLVALGLGLTIAHVA